MLGDQDKAWDVQFKCGFCGFVYKEVEEAEACELNYPCTCISRTERTSIAGY